MVQTYFAYAVVVLHESSSSVCGNAIPSLSMEHQMWPAIASFSFGILGWLAISFFAKPYLDFLILRGQVHEEIIYTANVGSLAMNTPDYYKAVESLRRLAARVKAAKVSASRPLGWFLSFRGYDLEKAGTGLIGLSNSLATDDGSRGIHRNSVQAGLKLPVD